MKGGIGFQPVNLLSLAKRKTTLIKFDRLEAYPTVIERYCF